MDFLRNRLLPFLDKAQTEAYPIAKLLWKDPVCFKYWSARFRTVAEELGRENAVKYTKILVALLELDAETARQVAQDLPEDLARISPLQHHTYWGLVNATLKDEPRAVPLVSQQLHQLLEMFDSVQLATFLAKGIRLFGSSPSKAASFLRLESEHSRQIKSEVKKVRFFDSIRKSITLYARGHCGETVQVRTHEQQAFSDGKNIYLPETIDIEDAYQMIAYRVLTARNAGFIEFGTLDADLSTLDMEWKSPREGELELERMFRSFPNSAIAKDLFSMFENRRIDFCVRQEYPGIARDMDAVDHLLTAETPKKPDAPAELAIEGIRRLVSGEPPLVDTEPSIQQAIDSAITPIQTLTLPDADVHTVIQAVIDCFPRIYSLLQKAKPSKDKSKQQAAGGFGIPPTDGTYKSMSKNMSHGRLDLSGLDPEERKEEERIQKMMMAMREGGEAVSKGEVRRKMVESYEEMSDFLERMEAPGGALRDNKEEQEIVDIRNPKLSEGAEPTLDTWLYPEWDESIQDTKPDWTHLREFVLQEGPSDFVQMIRMDYGAEIQYLQRTFSALRPEHLRPIRNIEDGDEIDFDKMLEVKVEQRAGRYSSKFYIRKQRQERDTVVAFLLDMSSSTNELAGPSGKKILEVEKEALVLISEAINALGDTFGIFGFSGYGREQVAFYIAKDFTAAWNESTCRRIGRMSWKMENRDGTAIRHCVHKLSQRPEKSKLLILLSDGKPLDCGSEEYSGSYAQADTKEALQQARTMGVRPFCITIDPYGQKYLSTMYGEANFIIIDSVDSLPLKISSIYRRLTR